MQRRFNRGRPGGRKRGSETPPTPMSGTTPTPSPEAHWLGRDAGPPGTVSRPTHCELGRNEAVRGPSRNQGSQGSHPCGSPRACGRLEGRGHCRLWRGDQWSPGRPAGCCPHTGPAGWEGQQARGWSSGAGVAEGTPKTSGQPAGWNFLPRGMRPVCSAQCGPRQPRAAAETLNARLCFL